MDGGMTVRPTVRNSPVARERAWYLWAWIVPLAAAAAVSFATPILGDGDTFWHLATGRWILDRGEVPQVDPFSFTYAGRPWVTHEWLSEVVMALAFRLAGWGGLMLLIGAAFGATAALMIRWLMRWLSPLVAGLTMVTGLACVVPNLWTRPHILSLPLLAFWTIRLLDARARRQAPELWLLPLMTLWANLHSSFVVGVGVAVALGLEAALDFRASRVRTLLGWAGFCLACPIVALITPHGVEGLVFPLKVMTMKSLPGISEWVGPDFMKVQPMEIALLAGFFFLFWRGARLGAVRAALTLLLVHMTFQHIRQEVLLGVLVPLIIAEPVAAALGPAVRIGERRPAPPQLALAGVLAAALVLIRVLIPETRVDGTTAPISALAHVPPALARQPVLNDYDFGGYLIFKGVRPYIDGRADMYGDPFIEDFRQVEGASQSAMERVISYYKIRWAIMAPGQPLVGALDRTPGWRRIYADRYAVVQENFGP
jgi:hypothetical protein